MRPRSRALATLALLLCMALLSGCIAGGAPAGGAPATGQGAKTTLKTAFQADMSTFDPDNGFEVAGLGAIRAVYEGLVDYAPGTTTVVGRLAEKFDVSPDGLTYTFTLRQGVTFHDGTPLTAAAVKASFARRATPNLSLSYFLASVTSTEARDDRTFVVTLSAPQPSFLDALASAWGPKVVSPEGLRQVAADPSWLNEHASGTGPFQLTSFRRGQGYTLTRFDRYWGTAPAVQEVDIAIVPDIGQQVLQLRSGQLDVVAHGYPFAQLEQLPAGLAVSTYDDLGLEMGYVNPVRTLKTAEQRRRVAAAVAPQKWVGDAFGRFARPADSLYPKAMLDPAQPYAYPTAQQVGTPAVPPIEIAYTADEAAVQQRVADLLIAQLRDAGIEATARSVPSTQVSSFTTDPAHAPDILLAQNNPDSAHPASQAGLFFATGAPLNVFGYSNPAADAQFTKAATLPPGPERDAAYAEAGRVVFDDGGFLPLADVADVVVHRAGLTDLGTRPAVPWNIDLGTVRWAA